MISESSDSAAALREELASLDVAAGAEGEERNLCIGLLDTLTELRFPGALVPARARDGTLRINVAAHTTTDWRRLRPILNSFAGPTLTGFTGQPQTFEADDRIGQLLLRAEPAVTAIMPLSSERKLRVAALRALTQAVATLMRAPDLQREAPVPTSWLLAQFQDHLNLGRRDAAAAVLQRLRTEMRLDGLNVRFLEASLFAQFEDWQGLVAMPGFADMTRARKSPGMAAILLAALYHVHLETAYEAGQLEPLLGRYRAVVQGLARPMLFASGVSAMGPAALRVSGLEALTSSTASSALRDALAGRYSELGWLAGRIDAASVETKQAPLHDEPPLAEPEPLDVVRSALIHRSRVDDIATLEILRHSIAQLDPKAQKALLESLPLGPFAEEIGISTREEVPLPNSWESWFARVSDPAFDSALELARRGAEEWPITAATGDPVRVSGLQEAVVAAQHDPLAQARTRDSVPYLIRWLQRDPDFPRPAFAPIYTELLLFIAIDSARNGQVFQSSQVLVAALLECGLDKDGYSGLLEAIDMIAGDAVGVGAAYWLLDTVEVLYHSTIPDAAAREAYLHGLLARLTPLHARLSGLQRAALHQLAAELGVVLKVAPSAQDVASGDSLAERLDGLSIAIYSLTEVASRQAKSAVEALCPGARVDINADHGGTARLKALAENADLFVVAWQSAKHAATDFIRANRGDRPLLYARGKGFSSILRALEDHLL
ncbi:protein DpdD [Thalassobaculum sp.]|uniref:protein DpdD n=1 Tax=Thalassobaculum sp. TaxID=2022740 RepID=UPI003B5CAF45